MTNTTAVVVKWENDAPTFRSRSFVGWTKSFDDALECTPEDAQVIARALGCEAYKDWGLDSERRIAKLSDRSDNGGAS